MVGRVVFSIDSMTNGWCERGEEREVESEAGG